MGTSPCGLVANLGRVVETYDGGYFTGEQGDVPYRDFESAHSAEYDRLRFEAELIEIIGPPSHSSRLLDVGSATGSFLAHARAHGWSGIGVEVSAAAREIAAQKNISSVASIGDLGLIPERFDVVTAHHVVEHLENPVESLVDLRSLLAQQGRLVIEVPNWASNVRRASGSEWIDLRPEQHRWHFTPSTLRKLVELAGFKPLVVGTLGEPIPSAGSVMTAAGIPLSIQRRVLRGTGRRLGSETPIDNRVQSEVRVRGAIKVAAAAVDGVVNRLGRGKRLYLVAGLGE